MCVCVYMEDATSEVTCVWEVIDLSVNVMFSLLNITDGGGVLRALPVTRILLAAVGLFISCKHSPIYEPCGPEVRPLSKSASVVSVALNATPVVLFVFAEASTHTRTRTHAHAHRHTRTLPQSWIHLLGETSGERSVRAG